MRSRAAIFKDAYLSAKSLLPEKISATILKKLLEKPLTELTTPKEKNYAALQSALNNKDLHIHEMTRFIVSLGILQKNSAFEAMANRIDEAILTSTVAFISGAHLNFTDFDAMTLQAFNNVVAYAPIYGLSIWYSRFDRLPDDLFQTWCLAVKESSLTYLDVSYVYSTNHRTIDQNGTVSYQSQTTADPRLFQFIYEIIEPSAKITSLNLEFTYLNRLAEADFIRFCKKLSVSQMVLLNLGQNYFDTLSDACKRELCMAFASPRLTHLDVNDNALGTWPTLIFKDFCKAISRPTLTSLNMFDNRLRDLDLDALQTFHSSMLNSGLTSLNIGGNGMGFMSNYSYPGHLDAWLNFIAISPLKSIDLTSNILDNLGKQYFHALCEAFASAPKLTSINLKENDFNKKQKMQLVKAAEKNINLQEVELDEEFPALKQVLNRNRLLHSTSHAAELFIQSTPPKLEKIKAPPLIPFSLHRKIGSLAAKTSATLAANEKTIQTFTNQADGILNSLQEAINMLSQFESPSIDRMQAKMQAQYDEVLWKKISWLHEKSIEKNVVIENLLAVRAGSRYYHEAHFTAFQSVFVLAREEQQTTAQAFIAALPCCINQANEFLQFNPLQQKIFDGFLIDAVGLRKHFGANLTAEHRIVLLQHLLMQAIQQEVIELAKEQSGPAFFDKRNSYTALQNSLSQLPTLQDLPNVNMEKEIAQQWHQMKYFLKTCPLKADNILLLIDAMDAEIAKQPKMFMNIKLAP